MAVTTYIFTMAQILQTAFIIAIIVEIFKLFGSFGKGGRDAARDDMAKHDLDKITKPSESKIGDAIASAEGHEKKLEDDVDKTKKLGNYLANLGIEEREHFKVLEQGLQILQKLQEEQRNNLHNEEITNHIKGVIDKMGRAYESLYKDLTNDFRTVRTYRSEVNTIRDLEKIAEDFKKVEKELEKELQEVAKKYKNESNGNRKGFLKNFMNTLEFHKSEYEHKYKQIMEIIALAKNEQNNSIKKFFEKVLDIIRRVKPSLSSIKTALGKVLDSVKSLEDASKRDNSLQDYDKAVVSLKDSINNLKPGLGDLINLKGNFNNYLIKTDTYVETINQHIKEFNEKYYTYKNKSVYKNQFVTK